MNRIYPIALIIHCLFFASYSFSMYEYDYCKEVYEAMGEFRSNTSGVQADDLKPLAKQIALTYAYRNNAKDYSRVWF